jgi:hypothetical protein
MSVVITIRRLIAVSTASAIIAFSLPSFAQEITEAHLKAARAAVAAIRATDLYDGILPASANALKQALIEKNPDLQELIVTTVDQKAVELAPRRADLEKEAATAYAKVFTEADLNAIAAFYTSDTGKKLLAEGSGVSSELNKAADIWQRGIARDLAEEVAKVLSASTPKPVAPADPAAPVDPAAPAEPAN